MDFMRPLIQWTESGLYCESGGFYIDPHGKVENAVITHAHSDHARRGATRYFCESSGLGLLRARLGGGILATGVPYRQKITLGEVQVSFHPAGHILGSSQIRVQRGEEVWVASGDYKRENDPSCPPFEIVPCETFITEATFGTPKFCWDKSIDHGRLIHEWWKSNAAADLNSILFGYSLGKAQRILALLEPHADRPILIHDSIDAPTRCYREQGVSLARTQKLTELPPEKQLHGELILAPPSILNTSWAARISRHRTAFASGWMLSGKSSMRTERFDDRFVLSDHADWTDLNRTIEETRATRIFVQHRNGSLIRHLRSRGIDAYPVESLTEQAFRRLPPVEPRLL